MDLELDNAIAAFTGNPILGAEPIRKPYVAPEPDNFGRYTQAKLPENVLVIPDIQAPFCQKMTLPFLSMVANEYQVDAVVGIGDELDLYQLSSYEKDPSADGMSRELEAGIKFWDDMFRAFPKASALHSNHGRGRIEGARKRGGFARQMLVDYRTLLGAPKGWEWYDDVILGHILFQHGDGEKKITKPYLSFDIPRNFGRHYSVVHGHRHEQHGRIADSILVGDDEYFGAYTGCLIDPYAYSFGYTKAVKARLGCLVISKGEPHRIPFRRDDRGIWTGKL